MDLPNVTASTTQHAAKKRYAFLPPSTGGNENSASVALDSKPWLRVSCSWTVSSDTALLGVTSSMDVWDIETLQSGKQIVSVPAEYHNGSPCYIYCQKVAPSVLHNTPCVVTPNPMLTAYLECLKLIVVLVGRTNVGDIGCKPRQASNKRTECTVVSA